jgi:hypothetical protein
MDGPKYQGVDECIGHFCVQSNDQAYVEIRCEILFKVCDANQVYRYSSFYK